MISSYSQLNSQKIFNPLYDFLNNISTWPYKLTASIRYISSSFSNTFLYLKKLSGHLPNSDKVQLVLAISAFVILLTYKSSILMSLYALRVAAIDIFDISQVIFITMQIYSVNQLVSLVMNALSIFLTKILLLWHKSILCHSFKVYNQKSTLYYLKLKRGINDTLGASLYLTLSSMLGGLLRFLLYFSDVSASVVFLISLSPEMIFRVCAPVVGMILLTTFFRQLNKHYESRMRDASQEYNYKMNNIFSNENKQWMLSHTVRSDEVVKSFVRDQSTYTYTLMEYIFIDYALDYLLQLFESVQNYLIEFYIFTLSAMGVISLSSCFVMIDRVKAMYSGLRLMIDEVCKIPTYEPVLVDVYEAIQACEVEDNKDILPSAITSEECCDGNSKILTARDLSCFIIDNNENEVKNDNVLLFRIDQLDIKSDDRILLVGDTGSGKSCLLSLIAGLISKDKTQSVYYTGDVSVDQNLVRLCTQKNTKPFGITDTKSWLYWPNNESMSDDDRTRAIEYIEEMFKPDEGIELTKDLRKVPLSGGQEKRLNAFCAVRDIDKKFLLLDETTNEMGQKAVEFLNIIAKNETIQGYIMSSHLDPTSYWSYFNKVLKLSNNSLKMIGIEEYKEEYAASVNEKMKR